MERQVEQKRTTELSPLYSFMYALKSTEARRQYPKRLKMLFDYLRLPNSLEEQATDFLTRAKQDGTQWAQHVVGNDCAVGASVTILPGTQILPSRIVQAGTTIEKD